MAHMNSSEFQPVRQLCGVLRTRISAQGHPHLAVFVTDTQWYYVDKDDLSIELKILFFEEGLLECVVYFNLVQSPGRPVGVMKAVGIRGELRMLVGRTDRCAINGVKAPCIWGWEERVIGRYYPESEAIEIEVGNGGYFYDRPPILDFGEPREWTAAAGIGWEDPTAFLEEFLAEVDKVQQALVKMDIQTETYLLDPSQREPAGGRVHVHLNDDVPQDYRCLTFIKDESVSELYFTLLTYHELFPHAATSVQLLLWLLYGIKGEEYAQEQALKLKMAVNRVFYLLNNARTEAEENAELIGILEYQRTQIYIKLGVLGAAEFFGIPSSVAEEMVRDPEFVWVHVPTAIAYWKEKYPNLKGPLTLVEFRLEIQLVQMKVCGLFDLQQVLDAAGLFDKVSLLRKVQRLYQNWTGEGRRSWAKACRAADIEL